MKQIYFKLLMPSLVAGSDVHPINSEATSFVAVCHVKHDTTNADDLTVCHNAEFYCRNNEDTGYDYNERRNIAIGDIICIEKCKENPVQRYYKYWGEGFELVRLEYNDGAYTYTSTKAEMLKQAGYDVTNHTAQEEVGDLHSVPADITTPEANFGVILSKVLDCSLACKYTDEAFQMRKLREECAELLLEDLRAQDGREDLVALILYQRIA